jgi:hypothetical protein
MRRLARALLYQDAYPHRRKKRPQPFPRLVEWAEVGTSSAVVDFPKKPKQPLIGASEFPASFRRVSAEFPLSFRQVRTVRSSSRTRLRYVGSAIDPPNMKTDPEQHPSGSETHLQTPNTANSQSGGLYAFLKQAVEASLHRPQSNSISLESSDGQRDTQPIHGGR